jgi:UDP-N-acetylglucosamine/UDP-N-acetylgalactosamine diphosphorylase
MALTFGNNSERVAALKARGVEIVCPESVEVGEEVDLDAIAPGAKLFPGTRIRGERTSIGPESELGREAPATVENCQLGRGVQLKGGYFSDAVFLDGAGMGSCAHVRGGTLMEEGAELAHAGGLKQSIFLPFAVGGSLINFCDALLSGGTDRKNHTEIGSSYVHFNYTPHGDKATASLVGDVPRGVFLDQPPVFLGGQGGMAGPVRVAFGTVVAAGGVLRRDVLEPGQLVVPRAPEGGEMPYSREYRAVGRVARNCRIYFGNVVALKAWYLDVRKPLMAGDRFEAACWEGAVCQLDAVLKERLKRLDAVAAAVAKQDAASPPPEGLKEDHEAFLASWPETKARMEAARTEIPAAGAEFREAFLAAWAAAPETDYIARVKGLGAEAKRAGTAWLDAIVAWFG